MYRKFLLLAVAALTVLPAVSQKMKRHEVSVSYGYAPVFNWIDDYRLLTGQFEKPYISYGIGGVIRYDWQISETGMWGAATMGYNFRLLKNLSIGVQAVYASSEQQVREIRSKITDNYFSIKNHYWAVMPDVKWTWMKLGIVSLYSRAGAGIVFTKAEIAYVPGKVLTESKSSWRPSTGTTESGLKLPGDERIKMDDTRTQFAFQLSPVGIEVGGRLAAYAEGGLGVSGSFVAGVRYQF